MPTYTGHLHLFARHMFRGIWFDVYIDSLNPFISWGIWAQEPGWKIPE